MCIEVFSKIKAILLIHFQVAEIFQMPQEGGSSADLREIDLIEDFRIVLTFNNKGYLIHLPYARHYNPRLVYFKPNF